MKKTIEFVVKVCYNKVVKEQSSNKFKQGKVINMNKTDLVEVVALKTGMTKKDAEAAVKAVNEAIAEALAAGDKVQLIGFGTYAVKARAAREGRNPKTGEKMTIAASKTPTFVPGKALKDAINN